MQATTKRNIMQAWLDAIVRMSSTRANYWLEVALDVGLGAILLAAGWQRSNGPGIALAAVATGLFAFSFIEYFFHRWMFHTRIPLFAQGHDKHHREPLGYDSLPFFLPAAILLGLTGLLVLVLPAGFTFLMAGAATFGYVAYGVSHFVIHHVRFKRPLLRRWAAAHHVHHYHPDSNFGVTSPLWDYLLGTRYVRQPRQPAA
ncbi:sterol desaturase family protein [Fulvimonas sp. R45]|uniref:sterol desaturase family protein n=1 Tax=Fulvimonas sp. R45 TaxID=3045937 RepID=UPI00265F8485|nr:sterol desaturase family protein [Fulvimonas sp. R45]MDO1528894.1 sterol desaturase family protein [Fulvimonas sp. R45]